MPILMDKILTAYADQAYETARLGRNGAHPSHDRFFADILVDLEASGDAMRIMNAEGRIAWRATPKLHSYLIDIWLDAEADLEDL